MLVGGLDEPVEDPDEGPAETVAAARLIDRRGRCRLAYEPIADLARGEIGGYEAHVRFPGAIDVAQWRVEATRRGLDPDFDAFAVASVLDARESLPPFTFLSVNLRAEALLRAPVRAAFERARGLDGLVVELGSRVRPHEQPALLAAVAALREVGAKMAVDGVGSGIATLQHAIALRPEFVKLHPRLVSGIHGDDTRRAIVETIGRLASQLDGLIVAQGVAEIAELDALMSLRVPLAQGPLIGVRAKTLTPVAFVLSAYVRERGAAARAAGQLVALLERPSPVEHDAPRERVSAAFDAEPALRFLPLVDAGRHPVAIAERDAHARGEPPARAVLLVTAASRLTDVAERAMLRPPPTRFHPVVCCDDGGRYVGLVRVERLVLALAAEAASGDAPAS